MRGKEKIDADAEFISRANRLCATANQKTKRLQKDVATPGGGFESADAASASAVLDQLAGDLQAMAADSNAKSADSFAHELRRSVDKPTLMPQRSGEANDRFPLR